MSDETTVNPPAGTGEISVDDAVTAMAGLLEPKKPAKADRPTEEESEAETVTDDDPAEAEANPDEEADAEQPEDSGEEEAETEEVEAEPPQKPERYTVKVNGEELKVTLDELKAGYSRDSDYRQKTQALQAERRAIEADRAKEHERLSTERRTFQSALEALATELMQAGGPSDQELQRLRVEDPQSYLIAMEDRRARQQRVGAIFQQAEQNGRQHAESMKAAAQKALNEGRAKLPELIPEWRDSAVQDREAKALAGYMERHGYSRDEIALLIDPRAVKLLRKAWQYDELQTRKPVIQKKVAQAPKPTVKPGPAPASRAQIEQDKQAAMHKQLKRTGRVEDAAALLAARMR